MDARLTPSSGCAASTGSGAGASPRSAATLEDEDGIVDRSVAYQRLMHEVIEAQRAAIVRLRNEGLISSDVMRRVERDLDLEESRLEI